jgi:hypothetical protein
MKNAGEALGPHPAFFERFRSVAASWKQYTACFQAILDKLLNLCQIELVTGARESAQSRVFLIKSLEKGVADDTHSQCVPGEVWEGP